MTRSPDDELRLEKAKARQRLVLMNAQRAETGRVWAVLLVFGWNVTLIGSVLFMFLDWRWLVAGWTLGLGNMLAGVVGLGRAAQREG